LDLIEHCIENQIIEDEDFEKAGAEAAWTHGTSSFSDDLTFFLGRLDGVDNPSVSRTFNITDSPTGHKASNATVEFVLYTIDDWKDEDVLKVILGTTTIDLGHFDSTVETDTYITGKVDGIEWWRSILNQGSNLGFGDATDKKHLVEFTIPSDRFPGDSLYFEMSLETKRGGVGVLSAGLDDFILEAYYDCHGLTHRRRKLNGFMVDVEATSRGDHRDSTSSTCTSHDFPCNGGNGMVYVCHFSHSHGYRTLCVAEKDFYHHNVEGYCGPCVLGR